MLMLTVHSKDSVLMKSGGSHYLLHDVSGLPDLSLRNPTKEEFPVIDPVVKTLSISRSYDVPKMTSLSTRSGVTVMFGLISLSNISRCLNLDAAKRFKKSFDPYYETKHLCLDGWKTKRIYITIDQLREMGSWVSHAHYARVYSECLELSRSMRDLGVNHTKPARMEL